MTNFEEKQTSIDDYNKSSKSKLPITLWFDSIKEAKDFAHYLSLSDNLFSNRGITLNDFIENIRKYAKHKTKYRQGIYWPILDVQKMKTSTNFIKAPSSITKVIEWQHQDHIIATNDTPVLTIETTDHSIVWNNVAQRIPRLIQSVSCGVPSIIFQKTDHGSTDKLIGWFLMSLVKTTKIFKKPCIAILYNDNERANAEKKLSEIISHKIESICFNDASSENHYKKLLIELADDNEKLAEKYYDQKSLESVSWLEIDSKSVRVVIGVKPDVQMWKTKGTGGLDPYPGLVLLADMLLCRTGPKKSDRSKKLIVDFKYIPKDFWWFKKYPTELYLQMLIDPKYRIADEVVYRC